MPAVLACVCLQGLRSCVKPTLDYNMAASALRMGHVPVSVDHLKNFWSAHNNASKQALLVFGHVLEQGHVSLLLYILLGQDEYLQQHQTQWLETLMTQPDPCSMAVRGPEQSKAWKAGWFASYGVTKRCASMLAHASLNESISAHQRASYHVAREG